MRRSAVGGGGTLGTGVGKRTDGFDLRKACCEKDDVAKSIILSFFLQTSCTAYREIFQATVGIYEEKERFDARDSVKESRNAKHGENQKKKRSKEERNGQRRKKEARAEKRLRRPRPLSWEMGNCPRTPATSFVLVVGQ